MKPRTLQGRLTVLFAASALILAGMFGVVVLVQFRSRIRESVDDGLTGRFQDVRQVIRSIPEPGSSFEIIRNLPQGESFVQIVAGDGTILAGSPRVLRHSRLLTGTRRRDASASDVRFEEAVPGKAVRARLLAGPAVSGGIPVVVVVGTSMDDTLHAENRLELLLLLGLPMLAGLVSLGGWFLIGAALAPVRTMIEDADDLSVREPDRRLAVPDGAGLELRELASRLNELLARIEAAFAHERAFLDDASHELRTPLAILRGEVELARLNSTPGTEIAASLDSVLEEVTRVERLTQDLLVLARSRATRTSPRPVVDARDAVEAALLDVRRAGGVGPVELTLHASDPLPVAADAGALKRAVANLVDNACRHASRRVEVDARADASDAVILVRDDGPGFPAHLLGAHAFERFVPGDGSPRLRGAGLGLAIVASIVAAHGGEVTADNLGSGGGQIEIRLPRADGTTSPAPRDPAQAVR